MEIKHLSFTCDEIKEKVVLCFHGSYRTHEKIVLRLLDIEEENEFKADFTRRLSQAGEQF